MRPVGVDADAAGMRQVVQIAADLRAALDDQHVAAGIGQRARDRRSGQPGADDQIVTFHAVRVVPGPRASKSAQTCQLNHPLHIIV